MTPFPSIIISLQLAREDLLGLLPFSLARMTAGCPTLLPRYASSADNIF